MGEQVQEVGLGEQEAPEKMSDKVDVSHTQMQQE